MFGCLALGLAGLGLSRGLPRDPLSLLVPANLALLFLLPERGVFTVSGSLRAALLLLQANLLLASERWGGALLDPALRFEPLHPALAAWARIPQAALLVTAAALALVGLRIAARPAGGNAGFFFAILSAFLSFRAGPGGAAGPVLLAASSLALAASVLEAAHGMAYRDPLTGIPGRRALEDALAALDGPFAAAMVDVDRFKNFNDVSGS